MLGDVKDDNSHLKFAAANEGEGIWRNMMAMGVTHQLLRLSVSNIPTAPHQQHYRCSISPKILFPPLYSFQFNILQFNPQNSALDKI